MLVNQIKTVIAAIGADIKQLSQQVNQGSNSGSSGQSKPGRLFKRKVWDPKDPNAKVNAARLSTNDVDFQYETLGTDTSSVGPNQSIAHTFNGRGQQNQSGIIDVMLEDYQPTNGTQQKMIVLRGNIFSYSTWSGGEHIGNAMFRINTDGYTEPQLCTLKATGTGSYNPERLFSTQTHYVAFGMNDHHSVPKQHFDQNKVWTRKSLNSGYQRHLNCPVFHKGKWFLFSNEHSRMSAISTSDFNTFSAHQNVAVNGSGSTIITASASLGDYLILCGQTSSMQYLFRYYADAPTGTSDPIYLTYTAENQDANEGETIVELNKGTSGRFLGLLKTDQGVVILATRSEHTQPLAYFNASHETKYFGFHSFLLTEQEANKNLVQSYEPTPALNDDKVVARFKGSFKLESDKYGFSNERTRSQIAPLWFSYAETLSEVWSNVGYFDEENKICYFVLPVSVSLTGEHKQYETDDKAILRSFAIMVSSDYGKTWSMKGPIYPFYLYTTSSSTPKVYSFKKIKDRFYITYRINSNINTTNSSGRTLIHGFIRTNPYAEEICIELPE